jgi:hypothetical protein
MVFIDEATVHLESLDLNERANITEAAKKFGTTLSRRYRGVQQSKEENNSFCGAEDASFQTQE